MALPNPLTDSDLGYLEEQYWQGLSDKDDASFQLDDIIDAPIAIVTDMAVSMANSIPFTDIDLDTQEVLQDIGAVDSAEFYQNHRTLVNVGSFVGGLVIPGMLVGKALQLARAGKYSLLTGGKLVGSRVRRVAANKRLKSQQAMKLVRQGDFYTKEYKKARRAWMGASLREGMMEGAAFEAAFIGLFNGHPFMDDYDTTDFVIGTAFGAAFVPLRYIVDAKKYKLRAAEIEQRMAESAQVGIYGNNLGIVGTKGDQLTAAVHNGKVMREDIAATDWTDNRGGFELAQRNERENAAAANDVAIAMMDKDVKEAAKEISAGGRIAAEETDIYRQGPLGLIQRVIDKNVASLNGGKKFSFFNSASPLGRAFQTVSDINYEVVTDHRLRGSADFAVEEFSGGTVDSVHRVLTGKPADPGEIVTFKSKAGNTITPSTFLGHEDWKEIGTVSRSQALADEGFQFTIRRNSNSMELHIYDDAVKFSDKFIDDKKSVSFNLLREVLVGARRDVGNVPFKIMIHHQAKKPSQISRLGALYNARRKLSTEAGQFQTDSMPASLTDDMIHGTRSPDRNQIFMPTETLEGRKLEAGVGYRDMLDMPDGHGNFAVVELPAGTKVATFHDARLLAEEAAAKNIDLEGTIISKEGIDLLQANGFVGREVRGQAKRRNKAPAVEFFPGAGAKVKRRLPADAKEAAAAQRNANGVSDEFDEFAVIEPYSQSVMPASSARSMQRAADIEGGYRPNKKFSMEGQTSKEYDPFSMSSAQIDAMFLDALHAVRRQVPKSVIMDFDDLPRLQAAHIADMGKGQKVKLRLASGEIVPIRNPQELAEQVLMAKGIWSRRLQESGYGMQQASVYTNTPIKGVEMMVNSGHRLENIIAQGDVGQDFFQYNTTNADRMEEFLNAKQLIVDGDPLANQAINQAQQWSQRDAQVAIDLSNNIIGEVSAQQASKVPLIGELYKLTDRAEFRAMIKHVSAFFARNVLGNPSINSMDFALRKLDDLVDGQDLGQFVAQTGQDFLRNVNETLQPIRDSLAGAFNSIAKNPAALIQFNDIYKALQKVPKEDAGKVFYSVEHQAFVTGTDRLGRPTNFLKYVRDNKFADETITIGNADLEDFFVNQWPPVQEMLYEMLNTNRKLAGMPQPRALGVWFPYNNLSEQNVAYIFNRGDNMDKARLIVGKTPDELESQIKAISAELGPRTRDSP